MNAIETVVETSVVEATQQVQELSLDILAMVGGGADGANFL